MWRIEEHQESGKAERAAREGLRVLGDDVDENTSGVRFGTHSFGWVLVTARRGCPSSGKSLGTQARHTA